MCRQIFSYLNIQNLLIAVINAINDMSDCDSSSLSGSSVKEKYVAVVNVLYGGILHVLYNFEN